MSSAVESSWPNFMRLQHMRLASRPDMFRPLHEKHLTGGSMCDARTPQIVRLN